MIVSLSGTNYYIFPMWTPHNVVCSPLGGCCDSLDTPLPRYPAAGLGSLYFNRAIRSVRIAVRVFLCIACRRGKLETSNIFPVVLSEGPRSVRGSLKSQWTSLFKLPKVNVHRVLLKIHIYTHLSSPFSHNFIVLLSCQILTRRPYSLSVSC